jgi:RNase P/RNase MRP subunit p29
VIEEGKERTVPKRGTTFEFTLDDGTTAVLEGDSIAYRTEDRIKRAGGRDRRAGDRK